MLLFWNHAQQPPLAVAVNVACPSQEVESGSKIYADFWHDVRLVHLEATAQWHAAAGCA